MKQEQAIEIATRFFTFRECGEPYDMTVKSMNGNRFTLCASGLGTDEEVYEIEIDPTCNEIILKQVVATYDMNDFMQQPTMLSCLKEGDLFRMEGDCLIWKYCGQQIRYGKIQYGICPKNGCNIFWRVDATVYPCGK